MVWCVSIRLCWIWISCVYMVLCRWWLWRCLVRLIRFLVVWLLSWLSWSIWCGCLVICVCLMIFVMLCCVLMILVCWFCLVMLYVFRLVW